MSYIYLTADAHFGHGNIGVYCNRPTARKEDLVDGKWVSGLAAVAAAERMDAFLIRKWNERVKPEDTVFHLGDFVTYGCAMGVKGQRNKPEWYEGQLNGKIVHVLGNHDRNNRLTRGLESATIKIGGKLFLMRHHPQYDPNSDPAACGVLCGHVHDNWPERFINGIPFINVGVDVRGYQPIRVGDVFGIYERMMRQ